MIFKQLKKLSLIALASLAALPMAGQDLLANQAPIDRKMKAVDSLMMQQLIMNEVWEAPAADLYEDWSNSYTHVPANLPDSFRIDLRDFCMPTTNRVVTSNFGARFISAIPFALPSAERCAS